MSEPTILWGLWMNSPRESSSRAMLAKVAGLLGTAPSEVEMTAYPKTDGHRIYFRTPLRGETWADQVLAAIQHGLCVGYGWSLTGDAENELSGWSNRPRVPGVVSVSWEVQREG